MDEDQQQSTLDVITFDELRRRAQTELREKQHQRNWPRLTDDGQAISLLRSRDGEDGDDLYDITLEEIPTPLDLLRWVVHLSEKNWMDAERLAVFVLVVVEAKEWRMRR